MSGGSPGGMMRWDATDRPGGGWPSVEPGGRRGGSDAGFPVGGARVQTGRTVSRSPCRVNLWRRVRASAPPGARPPICGRVTDSEASDDSRRLPPARLLAPTRPGGLVVRRLAAPPTGPPTVQAQPPQGPSPDPTTARAAAAPAAAHTSADWPLPLGEQGNGVYRLLRGGRVRLVDRFRASLDAPEQAQQERLRSLLAASHGTDFAETHGLHRVQSMEGAARRSAGAHARRAVALAGSGGQRRERRAHPGARHLAARDQRHHRHTQAGSGHRELVAGGHGDPGPVGARTRARPAGSDQGPGADSGLARSARPQRRRHPGRQQHGGASGAASPGWCVDAWRCPPRCSPFPTWT